MLVHHSPQQNNNTFSAEHTSTTLHAFRCMYRDGEPSLMTPGIYSLHTCAMQQRQSLCNLLFCLRSLSHLFPCLLCCFQRTLCFLLVVQLVLHLRHLCRHEVHLNSNRTIKTGTTQTHETPRVSDCVCSEIGRDLDTCTEHSIVQIVQTSVM